MGDTDFFGRVGELESLQDAYDSRIAEMAIIYGHRRIGKTALIKNSVKENLLFSTQRKHGKIRTNWIVFLRLWEHFAEIRNCAISNGLAAVHNVPATACTMFGCYCVWRL